jgi:zinc protease
MKYKMILLFAGLLLVACSAKQKTLTTPAETPTATSENMTAVLPLDSTLIRDTLSNGITYYLKKNAKPENRAELRLVINAGSILENEEQQGLAHFCEHMAFNGTENFEKNELIDYLELTGMRFGPDINAYTSFDETVYMLQVPTDSAEILETAFQVLEDWAFELLFDGEEIEKERGVVIEEWRLGRGASARIRDQQFPILFQGSRYAERLPIGKKAVLDTFRHETLKQFYRNWYRPDLMAIIAVGDFDVARIRQLIKNHFADRESRTDAPARKLYKVPGHQETLYAIASDPESRFSSVGLYYKLPLSPQGTVGDYRRDLVEYLYNDMFNQRLSEVVKKPDVPFIFANSGKGRFVRGAEVYVLNAVVKDNQIPQGLESLLMEAKRVSTYGFTDTELVRSKKSVLRAIQQAYEERDKTESDRLASEYIRNFLEDEPVPGIEKEYELFNRLIPGITMAEINQLTDAWISDESRVIMASYPEKEEINEVHRSDLEAALKTATIATVQPYVDNQLNQPLLEQVPTAGEIVSESKIEELGIIEFKMENGIRVIVKPTDFQNNEILFTAFSPGGISLVPDSLLVPAKTAVGVVRESGLGNFNNEQLDKALSGKVVRVSPYIDDLSEGFSGRSSIEDLETLFQLVYLYFTETRSDSPAFLSLKNRFEAFYQNRSVSPEAAFQDTITAVLTQYDPRFKPWTTEDISRMDLMISIDIFRQRFADASDFTFIFVGNVDIEKLKEFSRIYLANLPDLSRQENFRDRTYQPPKGIVEREIYKGLEAKSQTSFIFTGPFQWSLENVFTANHMVEALRIQLREKIREDLGGTYGVRVFGSFSHFPRERYQIMINFGSNPERVDELSEAILSQVDSLRQGFLAESTLEKVREISLREYQSNLKENDFWLNALEYRYYHGLEPETILRREEMIQNLTVDDVTAAAKKYLMSDNYIRVSLYPE